MGAKTIKLNSGHEMPLVGFGLWKVNNDTCADQVYNAIKTGYRLFDSAADYGNEKESGQGINRAIKEGIVKREELFITTKLWNAFHDYDRVMPMCKSQLKDMGLEYFDLYLIHFPISLEYVEPSVRYPPGWTSASDKVSPGKATLESTWRAMEEIHKAGLAKNIGISNYSGGLMLDLLRYAKIQPAALQIEHHPYLTQPALIKFCQDNNIAITAYSSFGPLSFIEIQNQDAVNTPLLMENDFVTSIAKKHDKTPAQILLRWATQRNVAVIPKSNNQGRLKQNLEVLDFNLSDEEIKQISSLERGLRFNNPAEFGFPIFA